MNSKQKNILDQSVEPTVQRSVEYVPPKSDAIEEFAKHVCEVLTAAGRGEFSEKQVCWNISNLLKLVGELTTKQMNREWADSGK